MVSKVWDEWTENPNMQSLCNTFCIIPEKSETTCIFMQSKKGVYAKIFCAQNALNTGSHSIGNGGWGVSDPSYQKGKAVWNAYHRGVEGVLPIDLVGFASVDGERKWRGLDDEVNECLLK